MWKGGGTMGAKGWYGCGKSREVEAGRRGMGA